jgi:uncharacterized membrane protein YccC
MHVQSIDSGSGSADVQDYFDKANTRPLQTFDAEGKSILIVHSGGSMLPGKQRVKQGNHFWGTYRIHGDAATTKAQLLNITNEQLQKENEAIAAIAAQQAPPAEQAAEQAKGATGAAPAAKKAATKKRREQSKRQQQKREQLSKQLSRHQRILKPHSVRRRRRRRRQ